MGHKILLVDDDADFREIFITKLSRAGFEIEVAANGQEGVEKAKTWRPDLILMDMKMPVMDGAEATQKLKEDPATKDIKIVFLSVYGDPGSKEVDEVFARQTGAVGYLWKIEDFEGLVEKIKSFL